MTVPSWMWLLPILPGTHNVISSQESQDGSLLRELQDGQKIANCGPQACRVSLSALPGRNVELKMTATFGRTCSDLFGHASPQHSWVSNLQTLLGMAGLTWLPMTWKTRVTPSGRQLSQLAPLARRTSGIGSGWLPTVTAREGRDWSRPAILASLDNGTGVAKRICNRSTQTLEDVPHGLNPSFAAWMMGYPEEWLHCMPSETRLSRKSRRPSSEPT